jgi:predicted phage terminase large subunit-like protein
VDAIERRVILAALWSQVGDERLDIGVRIDKLYAIRELSEGEERRASNFQLRRVISEAILGEFRDDWYEMLMGTYVEACRYDFESFVEYLEWDVEVANRFYLPRKVALRPAVDALQKLADGKVDVAVISMPPRIGKTTLGLLFCVWLAARNPELPVLLAGYSGGLAGSFYNGCLGFITGRYRERFKEMFPLAAKVIDTHAKDMMIDLGDYRRYKSLSFRSVDGTITGAVEAKQLLYMDDMVSGIEEALSKDRMDKLWWKITDDLFTRRKDGCKLLMIGTHWSVNDPLSRLKELYRGNRMAVVEMPALDENDESNFNFKGGFSTEHYHMIRDSMDEISWMCLYMQRTIERDGILFPSDALQYYMELPQEEPDMVISACDVSEGKSDSFCAPVAYVYGNDVYIEDVVFTVKLPEDAKNDIANLLRRHRPSIAQFESNSGGEAFANNVADLIKDVKTTIRKKRTTRNKETRIYISSDFVKRRFFFKDYKSMPPKSDYALFMRELTTYAYRGKNAHDDAADGVTMVAELITDITKRAGQVVPVANPFWGGAYNYASRR